MGTIRFLRAGSMRTVDFYFWRVGTTRFKLIAPALFNQGESCVVKAEDAENLLRIMIKSWKKCQRVLNCNRCLDKQKIPCKGSKMHYFKERRKRLKLFFHFTTKILENYESFHHHNHGWLNFWGGG